MSMPRIVKTATLAAALALVLAPLASHAADRPPDAWITTKVKMALLTTEGIDALAIDVDTFDGRVTLHGQVESDPAKQRAVKAARGVKGVREVRDLLAVVPEAAEKKVQASDDALRERVATVLGRDAALQDSDVEVKSVNDGIVVLAGRADTLSAHRRALEDARSVDGVRHVASEIESPDELADEEIWHDTAQKAGVMESLRKGASDTWITTRAKVALMTGQGLSPAQISVDTRHAVVTLFGTVQSEAAKEAAGYRVGELPGVKGVVNQLQVVPSVAAEDVMPKDEQIQDDVENRLRERAALDDSDIEVKVKGGVARLTGRVASQGDRLTALTVASATRGVKSVVDDLDLVPES